MKNFLLVIFTILVFFNAGGCAKQSGLIVWSFNDELENMLNNYYCIAFPDTKINYSIIPADQFQNRLDTALNTGRKAPDIFALDAAFVRKYVESGLLLDLTDIYEKNKEKLFVYPVEIGTYEGRVYGMSWQACPGAMFYRRSLARKYLGTDDPAVVQTHFSNFNRFLETAQTLRRRSNGSCVIVPSRDDLYDVFLGARVRPWIVDGSLHIDPAIELFMDMNKTIYDSRLDGRVKQKSDGWYKGLSGNLKDENSNSLEVFAYFLPTCGLHNIIRTHAPDTLGDWAMIPGPASFRWGGTWLGAYKDTENPEAVLQIIEWLTTNEDFLEKWAKDTSNIVIRSDIVDKIKAQYHEPFLAGQNHYAIFADIAKNINGKLAQGTDHIIEALYKEAVNDYAEGRKTRPQALEDFRARVRAELGPRINAN